MSEFEKDLTNVMGSFMEINLDCVEKQNQEIEQLKLDYELYKDNHSYKNYEVETKDNIIKQLKDVIEEVRKEVENSSLEVNTREYGTLTVCDSDNILQILDKAKGENNG